MMRVSTLDPRASLARTERIWKTLAGEVPPTAFSSWAWIGTWLRHLPRDARVSLHVVEEDGVEVAAFFLGQRTELRHGWVLSRSRHLNSLGSQDDDDLCVEHNRPVLRAGRVIDWTRVIQLLPRGWDEIVFPAMSESDAPLSISSPRFRSVIDRKAPCPYVDLAAVRSSKDGYLGLVRSSVRSQIKRSQKLYAAHGPITIQVAQTSAEALTIFDELIEMHTAAWADRGQSGAFASPYMRAFHHSFVHDYATSGEAQLLRVRAGDRTLGCLYNLVSGPHVSFYQSGLVRETDNRLKPGLVSHAAAVAHYAASGLFQYDFLAGSGRYKQDLSTNQSVMVWARVQRPLARFWLEDRLRVAKRALAKRRLSSDVPSEQAAQGSKPS